jgi:[acyl-carrier-protein] S-malonyltransferase
LESRVALLFPGQGSQYVGMGAELAETPFSSYLEQADEVLGYRLSELMLNGPEDQLMQTENTQPAILTYSAALFAKISPLLQDRAGGVSLVMGHSVGEYAALVAAGAIQFEDAVRLVHLRGKFMQEAVPAGVGAMYAVTKVPADIVEEACTESSQPESQVSPANYNDPLQTVISGEASACERAVAWIDERVSKPHRIVKLKVSAPFHSPLMTPAADKLRDELNAVPIRPNEIDYIANIDAKRYPAGTSPDTIRDNLYRQVAGSVLWAQSFSGLSEDTVCLECGPGRVLTGLGRRTKPEIKVLPLDKLDDPEALVSEL